MHALPLGAAQDIGKPAKICKLLKHNMDCLQHLKVCVNRPLQVKRLINAYRRHVEQFDRVLADAGPLVPAAGAQPTYKPKHKNAIQ